MARLLSRNNSVLLVVDVQGKLAQKAVNSELLHKRLQSLVLGCHHLQVPLAYTEQLPDKLGETTPVLKQALGQAQAQRFVKRTFSCLGDDNVEEWNNSGLRTWLGDAGQKTWLREEKKDVLLCGIEGHICVFQTCVDLLTRGHQVHVVKDCTSSQRQTDLDVGLARMEKMGAIISTTEMALFELLKYADMAPDSHFRKVSKLLVVQ